MPQMMPINWMFYLIFFIILFIIFNMMNYYLYINKINNNKKNVFLKMKNFNWKW